MGAFLYHRMIVSTVLCGCLLAFISGRVSGNPYWETTRQGVPVLLLQAPQPNGISINDLPRFDITPTGVIVNNALSPGMSQIGGAYDANPFYGERAADVVLIQVTGPHPSVLEGPLEWVGHPADVWVANPQGIWVNGASLLGASRITMGTGHLRYPSGQTAGDVTITLNDSSIQVGEKGLWIDHGMRVTMMAPRLVINGPVVGNATLNLQSLPSPTPPHHTSPLADHWQGIDVTDKCAIQAREVHMKAGGDHGIRLTGPVMAHTHIRIEANGKVAYRALMASASVEVVSNTMVGAVRGYLQAPEVRVSTPLFEHHSSVLEAQMATLNAALLVNAFGAIGVSQTLMLESRTVNNTDGIIWGDGKATIRGIDNWVSTGTWMAQQSWALSANRVVITNPLVMPGSLAITAADTLLNQSLILANQVTLTARTINNTPLVGGSTQGNGEWHTLIVPTSGRITALSQLTLSANMIQNAGVLVSDDTLMMMADTYQSLAIPMAWRRCGACPLLADTDWEGIVMAPTMVTQVSHLILRHPSFNQQPERDKRMGMLAGRALMDSGQPSRYEYVTRLGWWDGMDARYLIDQLDSDGTYVLATDGPLFAHGIATQMVRLKGYRRPMGMTDEAQAQWLMDEAIKVAPTMGLRIGVPLTPSQSSLLTHDMVWLVSQNGMLMPQVYVAPSSSPTIPWSRQWVVDQWQGSVGSWHQHDALRLATLNVAFREWHQSGLMWADVAHITVNSWVMAHEWWGQRAQWAGQTAWIGGGIHLTGDLLGTFDHLSLQSATLMASGGVTLNAHTMTLNEAGTNRTTPPTMMVGMRGIDLRTQDDLVVGHGIIRSSGNVAIQTGGSLIVTNGWERGSEHASWQGGRTQKTWEIPQPSVIMGQQVQLATRKDLCLNGSMVLAEQSIQLSASSNLLLSGATRTDTTLSEWERYDTSWWGLVKTHTWHRESTWVQQGIPLYLKAPDLDLRAGMVLASQGVIKEGDRTHESATQVLEIPMQDRSWHGSVHGSKTGIGWDWGALLPIESRDQHTDTWDERAVGNVTIARDTLSKRATQQLELIGSRLYSGGTLVLDAPTITLQAGKNQHIAHDDETQWRLDGLGVFNRTEQSSWGGSVQYAIPHQQTRHTEETVTPTWLTADQVMIQGDTLTWGGVMIEATSDVTIRSRQQMNWAVDPTHASQSEQLDSARIEWGVSLINRWGPLLWGGATDALSRGWSWATWLNQVSQKPREAGSFGFDWGVFTNLTLEGRKRQQEETGGVGVHIKAGRDVILSAMGGLTATGEQVVAGRHLVVSGSVVQVPLLITLHQQSLQWDTSLFDWSGQDRSATLSLRRSERVDRWQKWGTWQAPESTGFIPSSNGALIHDTQQIKWGGHMSMGWDQTGWGIRGWSIQTPGYDVSSVWWQQWSTLSVWMGLETKGPLAITRLGRAIGDVGDALGWGWSRGVGEGWEDYQRKVRVREAVAQLAPHGWGMGGGPRGVGVPFGVQPLASLVSDQMGVPSPQGIRTRGHSEGDGRVAGGLLPDAWGYYDPIEQMIYVGPTAPHSPVRWWETVGHELGHHVDHQQSLHPTEWRADRFADHLMSALRDEWGDVPPIPWFESGDEGGPRGLQWLPRAYLINGIGNTHGSSQPPAVQAYLSALNRQLGRAEVRPTRGIYNGGMVRNVWSVAQALTGQGPYDRMIQEDIESDLWRNPLQKGESITLIGYSGGGAVALNVAATLSTKHPVPTVILLGSPSPLGHRFNGTVIKVNGSIPPQGFHRWDPIPWLGNPLAQFPSAHREVWWVPVTHSGDGSYLNDPKAIRLVADQLRRNLPRP